MAISKVVFNNETVMDVTTDSVVDNKLFSGYNATANNGVKINGAFALQSKSVTPTASSQTVTPDSGYGLSSVTVNAAPLQSISVTPSASAQTVTPTSPNIGLSSVTVNAIPSPYIDPTDATATQDEICLNKTAYIATGKTTGTGDMVHTVPSVPVNKDTNVIHVGDDYYVWRDGVYCRTGVGAISVVDTVDPHGGTVRTIRGVSLAGDTVTPESLLTGHTAHQSDGTAIVGKYNPDQNGADVIFIDYDGTVVRTYSAAQINCMYSENELPPNPAHVGLTAQGWNWTLAQIKSQLTNVGAPVVVGQMYVTTSGDTEIDISIRNLRCRIQFTLGVNGEVSIDWGDGSELNTVTGTSIATNKSNNHTYASGGDYTIKVTVVSGSASLNGVSRATISGDGMAHDLHNDIIKRVRLGSNMSLGHYAFASARLLETITIPNNVDILSNVFSKCCKLSAIVFSKSLDHLDSSCCYHCNSAKYISVPSGITSFGMQEFCGNYNLQEITIPNNLTSIGTECFEYCYNLNRISLPNTLTSIGNYGFQKCYNIKSINLPSGLTTIGNYAFSYMSGIKSINLPSGLTTIGNYAFSYMSGIKSIIIPSTVTSFGTYVFQYCSNLDYVEFKNSITSLPMYTFYSDDSLKTVILPNTVTSIGKYAFYQCNSLYDFDLPSGVNDIGEYAFNACYALPQITFPNIQNGITTITPSMMATCNNIEKHIIPQTVTTIQTKGFYNNTGVAEYHFLSTTPPTLENSDAFTGIPSDCIIYVPYSADHSILNAYMTATNWTGQASKMQEEPQ